MARRGDDPATPGGGRGGQAEAPACELIHICGLECWPARKPVCTLHCTREETSNPV